MTSRQLYSIDLLGVGSTDMDNVEPRGGNPGFDAVSPGDPPEVPAASGDFGPVHPPPDPVVAADPVEGQLDQAAHPEQGSGGVAQLNIPPLLQQVAAGMQAMAESNVQIVERLTAL